MSEPSAPSPGGEPQGEAATPDPAVAPAGLPADQAAPADVDLVAAALRADASDLESYHRILSGTVGSMLPAGMVEVDRERSLGDRVAGREGKATSIKVLLGDRTLELTAQRGRLVATSAHTVRGVVISRQEISVAEWTRQLAEYLAELAQQSAESRAALAKLLGGG